MYAETRMSNKNERAERALCPKNAIGASEMHYMRMKKPKSIEEWLETRETTTTKGMVGEMHISDACCSR